MGVIRNWNNSLNDNDLDRDLIEEIIDNIIDNNADSEPEPEASNGSTRVHRNRENRLQRNRLRPEPTFRALGVRGKSHKKSRRYANANILPQHLDNMADEELNDISIYDFIPETVSAFAQLLIQRENIEAFNELVNCTEEEQNQLLDEISGQSDGSRDYNSDKTERTFNADQCYDRIDSDLKNLFRRKRIPLGVLTAIEEEITDFFNAKPLAIYKSCLPSGFERLLLHGCCQYLDLKCLSFNSRGERWSKVRNTNQAFTQPSVMLAKYLETRIYGDS